MLKKIVNFGNARKFWKKLKFFLQSTHNDEQIKNLKTDFLMGLISKGKSL
jgi:hypothetical protein